VPSLARDTSLKLLPDIASRVPARVAQLNLTVSTYVAVLIWNYAQAPWTIEREPDSTQLARVAVPCYFRQAVAPALKRIAAETKMSANAVAEALIAHDLRSAENGLTILPARGKTKPKLPP